MTMADFVEANLEEILAEWERFAATLQPAATGLGQKALRDYAAQVLSTLAKNMREAQTPQEEKEKSRGQRPAAHPQLNDAARTHASDRLIVGFTLNQMVAEYRALRASVVRRWTEQMTEAGREELDELTRFNEALDESLTNAIASYAEQLEQARDLYTGALAHDLRNPLSAILTSAEALSLAQDSCGAAEQTSGQILRSGQRMKHMIDDLLDFTLTRLGSGLPLDLSRQDMVSLARQVAKELEHGDPQCDVRLEVPETLPGVWDGGRIQQMLSNLLGNAVCHCAPGTAVLLQAQAKDDQLVLAIHNEGPAIPAELQRHLFEPLTRGPVSGSKRRSAGRGLGLYIARQIAEAHGGTVGLTATGERGTTFTVTLPRESEPGQETAGLV
jgi:signal transduction histidine kinase